MAIAGRIVEPAIGSMRVNTTTNNIEVYEGTRWVIAHGPTVPETWEDWLKRYACLLYTSPSPRDRTRSRMPSSA